MFLKRNNVTITWRNSYTPRLLTLTFTIEFKSQLKSLKIFCQISLFKNRNLVVINWKVNVPILYKNFVPIALTSVCFLFFEEESMTSKVLRQPFIWIRWKGWNCSNMHVCMYVCIFKIFATIYYPISTQIYGKYIILYFKYIVERQCRLVCISVGVAQRVHHCVWVTSNGYEEYLNLLYTYIHITCS